MEPFCKQLLRQCDVKPLVTHEEKQEVTNIHIQQIKVQTYIHRVHSQIETRGNFSEDNTTF